MEGWAHVGRVSQEEPSAPRKHQPALAQTRLGTLPEGGAVTGKRSAPLARGPRGARSGDGRQGPCLTGTELFCGEREVYGGAARQHGHTSHSAVPSRRSKTQLPVGHIPRTPLPYRRTGRSFVSCGLWGLCPGPVLGKDCTQVLLQGPGASRDFQRCDIQENWDLRAAGVTQVRV